MKRPAMAMELVATGRRCAVVVLLVIVVLSIAHAEESGLEPALILGEDHLVGMVSEPVAVPQPNAQVAGFRGEIRIGDVAPAGPMPIEIRLNAVGTFVADRNLRFRFRGVAGEVAPPRRDLEFEIQVVANQGSQVIKQVNYLPKWAATRVLEFEVIEDGRILDGYQGRIVLPGFGAATGGMQIIEKQAEHERALDCLLVTHASPADSIKIQRPELVRIRNANKKSILISQTEAHWFDTLRAFASEPLQTNVRLSWATFAEASNDWRGYQAFDWIAVHQATLQAWMAQHPDAKQALREWIMMGGLLIVQASSSRDDPATEPWSSTQGIATAVGATVVDLDFDEPTQQAVRILQHAWRSDVSRLPRVRSRANLKGNRMSYQKALEIDLDGWQKRVRGSKLGGGALFLVHSIPVDDDSVICDSVICEQSLEIIEQMMLLQRSPMLRRGVDPMIGDVRFRKFLIPGVAEPPVYTFMGLLTLFVILVGPIAYRQTTLAGRNYLMFAIAPVLAIITTLLMFGYGLVSDGLGTVARLRQVMVVDAKSDDAIERCRSSYFAGVRPSNDLLFAKDAEVMTYPESGRKSLEDQVRFKPAILADVVVSDSGQAFSSSLISSRTTTQFVTHRPIRDVGHLMVRDGQRKAPQASTLDPSQRELEVTNHFDFPLRRLTLRDAENEYWHVPEINPGETKRGQFLTRRKASPRLGRLYNDFRIVMPTGQSPSRSNQPKGSFDLISSISQVLKPGSVLQDGVIEDWLQQLLQIDAELPSNYFIAISDLNQEDLLVEEATVVDSVRFVLGTVRHFEHDGPSNDRRQREQQ